MRQGCPHLGVAFMVWSMLKGENPNEKKLTLIFYSIWVDIFEECI